MDIRSLTLLLPSRGPEPARVQAWQVGALLQATVVSATKDGQAEIRIGADNYRAQTAQPLRAGEQMTLRVVATGSPVQLQVLQAGTAPDAMQAALRQALPQQQSYAPLLADAAAALRPDIRTSLPPEVQAALQRLAGSQPGAAQATTAEGLKQAIRQSGVFLESQLAREAAGGPRAQTAQDFKAAVLVLARALAQAMPPESATTARTAAAPSAPMAPPPPPGSAPAPQAPHPALLPDLPAGERALQLATGTQGALARIELNQLASVQQGQAVWVELPLRRDGGSDVVQLRIGRDGGGGGGAAEDAWSVSLALDLPGLGPVRSLISLRGAQVSVGFWSEDAATHQRLHDHLADLRASLEQAGLDVGRVASHAGAPPPDERPPGRLLSERA